MKRVLPTISALCLGVAVLATPSSAIAARPAQERAPECGLLKVANTDGTHVWLKLCGGGPGEEQALHNWAKGTTVTMDGAFLRGDGCGSLSSPCTAFSIKSPAS